VDINQGKSQGTINDSYATGTVSATRPGGFVGWNRAPVGLDYTDAYWDTTTSGTTKAVGEGHSAPITGLTTTQLQSGLPAGFDPSIWGENATINGGLPYLLANPPP
jgi:hypothetical protein